MDWSPLLVTFDDLEGDVPCLTVTKTLTNDIGIVVTNIQNDIHGDEAIYLWGKLRGVPMDDKYLVLNCQKQPISNNVLNSIRETVARALDNRRGK